MSLLLLITETLLGVLTLVQTILGNGTVLQDQSSQNSRSLACGGLLTEAGTIESPNFPGPYPPGLNCVWDILVSSSEETAIHLTINFLDLGPECAEDGDYLEIQVGADIDKICGDAEITTTISSNTRHLALLFVTNEDGLQGDGFSIDVTFGNDDGGNNNNSTCREGYTFLSREESCVDIDECSLGAMACDPNASCTNTPGSYICECNDGYQGDGSTCTMAAPCPEGWVTYPGATSCYFFSDDDTPVKTHKNAESYCQDFSGHLVCVDSPEEQNFVGTHWTGNKDDQLITYIGFWANDPVSLWNYVCHDGSLGVHPKPWSVYNEKDLEPEFLGGAAALGRTMQWGWKPCDELTPVGCEINLIQGDENCPDSSWGFITDGEYSKCVNVLPEEATYDQAVESCAALAEGAQLLTLQSYNITGQLPDYVPGNEHVEFKFVPRWLGLKKANGSSEWVFEASGEKLEKDVYQLWISPELAEKPNYSGQDLCGALALSELVSIHPESQGMAHFICEVPFSEL